MPSSIDYRTFTQEELIVQLPQLLAQDLRPVERTEYSYFDFDPQDSEQTLEVYRAKTVDFDNALQFWIHSLRGQEWPRQEYLLAYVRNSLCVPLTATRFESLVNSYTKELRVPLQFVLSGEFITAMQMHDEWDEAAYVAEYSEEYVSFYWSTTA